MDDSMMVGTDNHLIACVVIEAFCEVVNMVGLANICTIFFSNDSPTNLAAIAI